MITTTGREIVTGALELLGVVGEGGTATAAQLQNGLKVINRWIDALGVQPQSMYTVTRSVTTCAPFEEYYTIGPNGDFDMARPAYIQNAGFIVPGTSGETEQELHIPTITDDMYAFNQMKNQRNSQPVSLYYEATNEGVNGQGRIYLWPILNQSVQIVLYIPEFIAQLDTTTSVLLVPALERALRFNLAKESLTIYGRNDPFTVQYILREAGGAIADFKRGNARLTDLPSDALFTGNRRYGYNINTGTGG